MSTTTGAKRTRHPGSGLLGTPEATGQKFRYDLPRVVEVFRGAYVVGPDALRDIERKLLAFVNRGAKDAPTENARFQVFEPTSETKEVAGASAAIALRNPRATPIYAMIISAKNGDARAEVQLDSSGRGDRCALRLFATGPDIEAVSSVAGEFRGEAKNTRDVVNSWHRWLIDSGLASVKRHLPRIFIGVMVLGIAMIVLATALAAYATYEQQKAAAAAARARPPQPTRPEPKAVPPTSAIPTPAAVQHQAPAAPTDWRAIGRAAVGATTWVLMGLLVLFALYMYGVLFPRLVFEIGEGGKRFELIKKIRYLVFCSIILMHYVVPVAEGWVVGRWLSSPQSDPSALAP